MASVAGRIALRLERIIPKLVIAPGFLAILLFVYGFIIWTAYISFSKSKMLPNYDLIGLRQYERLFQMDRWNVAFTNLIVFGVAFIAISIIIGVLLAILLDQRIRIEGAIRTIYLYPMAISFVITGTAWKWIMNPSLGLETVVHSWGVGILFVWLDRRSEYGGLCVGDGGGVAVLGLCHGPVSFRSQERRSGYHQGGQS